MHPSSASADFTGTAILRLCFGRAVFVCQVLFLLDWGARLRRSVGCPEGARQTRVSNRCSSIAWAAGPPQRCTPVQQALILPILRFYGSASAEPFLFVRRFSCWTGGHDVQVCRLPRRGETDARFKSLLKHRVGGGAAPAMHPSSASATATTAASGGNREELLGLRPAGYEARSRAEIDAGNRNPGKTARRCGFSRAVMSVKVNFFPDGLTFLLFGI